jgi:hypothetical protein
VATPVAGFRDLAEHLGVAEREAFVEAVRAALASGPIPPSASCAPASWDVRVDAFELVLRRSGARAPRGAAGAQ